MELDDIIVDDLSTDSDDGTNEANGSRIPSVSDVVSPLEKSYVVKRMNQSNGTVYYQPATVSKSCGNHNRLNDSIGNNNNNLVQITDYKLHYILERENFFKFSSYFDS